MKNHNMEDLSKPEVLKRILASKEARRKFLAQQPIEEKWRILKIMQGWARDIKSGKPLP
jgi:hypothetical protein